MPASSGIEQTAALQEFHWLFQIIHSIDVGIVVLDRNWRVCAWNGFMENHSGLPPHQVIDKFLFDVLPDLDAEWLESRLKNVLLLDMNSFTVWEQRPYIARFSNYQPVTGVEDFMYQNMTLIPLTSSTGLTDHVAMIIYNVTDIATNRKQLQAANEQLTQLSRTDALTGLNNRGYWEHCLQQEFNRCSRYHSKCSLIMFDIDHFKNVNDTYGHQAGDAVIRALSEEVRRTIRHTDVAGRYGGEEFGIILVETALEGAMTLAERLRKKVEACTVEHDKQEIPFTISIGVAEIGEGIRDYKAWMERTDSALYESKHNGRNRTTYFGHP